MGQITEQSTALTVTEINSIAVNMIKGGLLPKELTIEAAVTIAIKGQELGIPPVQSLSEIYVIKGRAELKAELKLQLAAQRIPGFSWDILESSSDRCTVEYSKIGFKPFKYTFTMKDAMALGVTDKDNWKKAPALMLFYRNVSNALRMYAPEYKNLNFQVVIAPENSEAAISSLTGIRDSAIDAEVVDDNVDHETGEIMDAEIIEEQPQAKQQQQEAIPTDTVDQCLSCSKCNAAITSPVATFSMKAFSKPLCMKCQKQERVS